MTKPEKSLSVIAIIPARSGSKGVPQKNIRLLNGKPLISYAIEVALKSPSVERVIVSTDDEEIAKIVKEYGAEAPFLRPAELAGDHVPDQPVFQHVLKWLEVNERYSPEYALNMRCTTPLKIVADVENVVKELVNSKCDSVRTMTRVEGIYHPYWMYKEKGGLARPFIEDINLSEYYQRQLLPPVYRINGVVDGIKRSVAMNSYNFYGDTMSIVEVPEERSHDIDTEIDFEFIEFLMKRR